MHDEENDGWSNDERNEGYIRKMMIATRVCAMSLRGDALDGGDGINSLL